MHNSGTPGYLVGDRYVYELETFYQTPAMTPFAGSYTFPTVAVRVGNSYRARVRHIDDTGRASNWSDPIEFAASEPDVTPYRYSLVISDIMYFPLAGSPL